jgi:hypothetical protein
LRRGLRRFTDLAFFSRLATGLRLLPEIVGIPRPAHTASHRHGGSATSVALSKGRAEAPSDYRPRRRDDYAPMTDIDLYAYAEDGGALTEQVGQSSGGTADGSITLPGRGTYAIYVDLFNNPGANPLNVLLHSWTVTGGPATNFTVIPGSQSVTLGGSATVTASWSNLTAGGHYLGLIEYSDGTTALDQTVVTVNP